MKMAYTDDQVLPYPKSRRFLEAAMRSTHHKPMIHGLLEVDVTGARAALRDYQTRTGEPLSFTAFIIVCLAKAVDENKVVHALRWGSSRVILFADVDVLTWVEREVGGQQMILPYIFRSANHKTLDQIHREIRTAQVQDLSRAVDGGAKAARDKRLFLESASPCLMPCRDRLQRRCCCRFSCRLTPTLSGIGRNEQRQITLSVNDLTISCRTSYSPSVA